MIYDAGRAGTEKQRRAPCLEALVEDAAKHDQAKIVFDLDDSLRSGTASRRSSSRALPTSWTGSMSRTGSCLENAVAASAADLTVTLSTGRTGQCWDCDDPPALSGRPDPCYDRPGALALTCRPVRGGASQGARRPDGW